MPLPRKILYVHYQVSARDGTHTHTSAFIDSFGRLCQRRGIEFEVMCPPLIDEEPASAPPGRLARLRSWLARMYLRDIKRLLEQARRYPTEKRFLRDHKPELVITRHDGNPSILWAASRLGIPVLAEMNAPDVEAINAHYRHIPLLSRIFSNRYALHRVHGAYAVSTVLADHLRSLAPTALPVAVIPNGADPTFFDRNISGSALRARYGIAQNDIVIGFIGSFLPWHGVPLLLASFERLLKRHPQLCLMLVGQKNAMVEELQAQANTAGFGDKVVFTGHIPRDKMPEVVAAFDIAVMPNSNWYGSPLKLFEYMAMAKAIAMVDTPPIAEVFRHETDGLLFPADDPDALTDTLARLIDSAALRTRYGNNAHQHLCAHYTWDHNAERVMQLVEQITQQE